MNVGKTCLFNERQHNKTATQCTQQVIGQSPKLTIHVYTCTFRPVS